MGEEKTEIALWMRAVNNKPVVEHVEAVADVAKVLDPLHLVPAISHKPLVIERQRIRLLDEQIAVCES